MPSDPTPRRKSTATKKKTTTKRSATKKTAKKSTTARKSTKRARTRTTATTLRVRQVRSGIGSPTRIRRTLAALGLRHHQAEAVLPDNPSIRGMLGKVRHLVSVSLEETS